MKTKITALIIALTGLIFLILLGLGINYLLFKHPFVLLGGMGLFFVYCVYRLVLVDLKSREK
jgi:hypothetical protein